MKKLIDIDIESALKLDNTVFIDVRSQFEFNEDSIPGSINWPLLDNNEREIVGKIFKNEGQTAARRKALNYVALKMKDYIEFFYNFINKNIIIFCWRGGERSKNVSNLLKMVDINVFRIKGGYKAYRRLVYDYLYRNENYFKNVFVLEGLTGVGKTKILNSFSTENNIIDLEDLANNKGSVFGNIGLDGQPSQKKFDSLIFKKLYHKDNYEMILVEGESKRIGRVFIPDLLWESMNRAKKLYIYDDIENRVKRIIKDYLINSNIMIKEIESAIQKLKSRLGKETVEELINNLYEGEFKDVTLFLLQNYYDKIYNLSNMDEYQIKISSANIEKACEKILIHIRNNCERR